MKTKGCEVWEGYLAAGFRRSDGTWTPSPGIVPDALWSRLKQAITRACLLDAYKADCEDCRRFRTGHELEIFVFRRWVERLGLPVPAGHYQGEKLWPWGRGWSEDAVDAYLTTPVAREAA